MPSRLVLQFLGIPQIHLDDQPAATDRRKAVALLSYLAVNGIEHPQQKCPRPLIEQVDVDKTIAACLIKMGEVAFSDAYDQGTRMTLAEAVALVMSKKWRSARRAGRLHCGSV